MEKRGLLGYIKENCSLPGEGAMQFGAEWKRLTDQDKQDLLRWAHEQGDTHVVISQAATK